MADAGYKHVRDLGQDVGPLRGHPFRPLRHGCAALEDIGHRLLQAQRHGNCVFTSDDDEGVGGSHNRRTSRPPLENQVRASKTCKTQHKLFLSVLELVRHVLVCV